MSRTVPTSSCTIAMYCSNCDGVTGFVSDPQTLASTSTRIALTGYVVSRSTSTASPSLSSSRSHPYRLIVTPSGRDSTSHGTKHSPFPSRTVLIHSKSVYHAALTTSKPVQFSPSVKIALTYSTVFDASLYRPSRAVSC